MSKGRKQIEALGQSRLEAVHEVGKGRNHIEALGQSRLEAVHDVSENRKQIETLDRYQIEEGLRIGLDLVTENFISKLSNTDQDISVGMILEAIHEARKADYIKDVEWRICVSKIVFANFNN